MLTIFHSYCIVSLNDGISPTITLIVWTNKLAERLRQQFFSYLFIFTVSSNYNIAADADIASS